MDGVFKLLIFAIAAAAILFLLTGYFGGNEDQLIQEIRKGLDYAEANTGKLHSIEATIKKDTAFSATSFDSASRSVRFLCSSPGTCSGDEISISSRILKTKKGARYKIHFRCEDKDILNDCVIYFGEEPAQLEISEIGMDSDKKSITFTTKNTGKLESVKAEYSLKVYSQSNEGEKLVEEKTGTLQELSHGESQKTTIALDTETQGEYRATVTVRGENSGSSTLEKTFRLSAQATNCIATTAGTTTLLNGKCRTKLLCENCDFGADCAAKWEEKGITGITEIYNDGVYTEEEPINGTC